MRASFISGVSFLLTGCVAVTTSGTEEAVLFSDAKANVETAAAVLKPYKDLPLSVEFICPTRLTSLMTSYVVPLPPVLPVGFANKDVSYVRITMPDGAEDGIAKIRIIAPEGKALPLAGIPQFQRAVNNDSTVDVTYALNRECETLNGGVLEVAGLSYKNRSYPPSQTRLQFESRIRNTVEWWPPSLINGVHAVSGGIDDSGNAAR